MNKSIKKIKESIESKKNELISIISDNVNEILDTEEKKNHTFIDFDEEVEYNDYENLVTIEYENNELVPGGDEGNFFNLSELNLEQLEIIAEILRQKCYTLEEK